MRTTYSDSTEIGSKRGPGQTTAAPGGAVTGLAKQGTPHATSVEGADWPQDLAGLRADVPSDARGADGERTGGPAGARNTGNAASRNPADVKSPEANRRLRASP